MSNQNPLPENFLGVSSPAGLSADITVTTRRRRKASLREAAVIAVLALLVFAVSYVFNGFASITNWIIRRSPGLLGELLLTLIFLAVAGLVFYYRRWKDLQKDTRSLFRLARELDSLRQDLERRVAESSASLAATSLELAAETGARQHADKRLKMSEERYHEIFNASPLPMWLYDEPELRIREVNQAAIEKYGYSQEEFLKLRLVDLRPREDVEKFLKLIASHPPVRWRPGVHLHRKKDGSTITVDVYSHRLELDGERLRLAALLDVTEQRNLEEQLRQSQKMEAIGMLAGGVAHDFNNLLTAILGYADVAGAGLPQESDAREDLAEIQKAAERAAGLTRQLLAFARKQVSEPRVLDVNETVSEMDRMLRRLLGERIDLVTRLGPSTGHVLADPGQLEQVVMNLAVNARDAMPEGGRLTIETADVKLGPDYAGAHLEVTPGSYVLLAVSDTGIGMDEETRSHIFEPFFTTKEKGAGTGLGLSTVYGIVKQAGGSIWVYSEPGRGTTFKIYLPRTEKEIEHAIPKAAPRRAAGDEKILLVEDDAAVRGLIRRTLTGHGYRVLEASNGEEAITLASQEDRKISLVLTDAVMPGMEVSEMLRRLRVICPDTLVLMMSGYSDEAVLRQGIRETGMAFLQKPFSPEALLQKVHEVLDRAEGSRQSGIGVG